MIELRPYQQTTVNAIRKRERKGKFRACLASPTGSGKTMIMGELLRDPLRQLVATHRKPLYRQICGVLDSLGIAYGHIAAGRKPAPELPIQIAMTQTLSQRIEQVLELYEPFDRVHQDEMHVQGGRTWLYAFEQLHQAGATIIGYSATPSDLGGIVDGVYQVGTVSQMIADGFMRPRLVFGCGQPDMEQLDKLRRDAQGNFLPGDIGKLVKPKFVFGRVLEHRRRLCPDKRAFMLFAHDVRSSLWWAERLSEHGIPTAHIDSNDVWVDGRLYKSDDKARDDVFARLEGGELEGVSNRFVLREGIDCSCIGHVIVTCPVGSRTSWVQMCGRARGVGYDYVIIQDHGGSAVLHPPLDSDEPWLWNLPAGVAERARIKGMRDQTVPEPITCPECMCQRMTGETCPYCGFRYAKLSRYVIQADGTLRLVEGRAFKSRQITRRKGQDKAWERLFWSARKNNSRTPEQLYAYHAYKNNWEWLPRDLPLMPKYDYLWFVPCRDISSDDLIPAAI